MSKEIPKCKRFTGYKPCFPDHNCWEDGCKEHEPIGVKILIINLDAMGDVLMTTAQLESIKEKYPESTIYWVTLKAAAPLLDNNYLIDRVFKFDFESILILQNMEFDIVMSVDKSMRSCSIADMVKAGKKLGFGMNNDGKIYPYNKGAEYNYQLGMDDHLKFNVNQRLGQEYLSETLELPYQRNEYVFSFYKRELEFIEDYKNNMGIKPEDKIIGFNTGCSNLYPNKKMTIEQHRILIEKFLAAGDYKIMLLGGPEDTERNKEIYKGFEGKIINTPTTMGVRYGAAFMSIPDVIISGDSFGMHLAIALKKYVIAWFGLSCWTEIDLYDRGIKLYPEGLECSPCWKKECPFNLECIQMIDLEKIVTETERFFREKPAVTL